MIRILIADDHPMVLDGMKQLFALVSDVTVAGEAANGEQVMELLRKKKFDLVLLDMNMPGISGAELISWIRSRDKNLPVLVYSMHNEPQVAASALDAGASGYLTKDNDPETVMAAVRRVLSGEIYIDPVLAERVAFRNDAFKVSRLD